KKKVLAMEKYNRGKTLKKYKDSNISDEILQSNKSDIDLNSIMNRLAALTINCIEQEEKLNHSNIKNMI
ncbi:32300_t:CDS:1, partial [Racocetra persica]